MKVFIYGSLKKGYINHSILYDLEAKYLGEVKSNKLYLLMSCNDIVDIKQRKKYAYPFAIPYKGDKNLKEYAGYLTGELYEIPDENIEILDRFEGHPEYYKRTLISTNKGNAYIYEYVKSDTLVLYKKRMIKPVNNLLKW